MRKFITFLAITVLLCAVQTSFAEVEPNDQYYSRQWGLKAIHAPAVWEITTGSSNVYAAVMDSGIDSTHEDIRENFDADHSMNFSDTASYEDREGHGTHVAGIIGARGNNGRGVSGMAWNVKLIALKVDDKGNILNRKREEIICGALKHVKSILDANPAIKIVLNISLGWYDSTPPIRASATGKPVWEALHELDATGRVLICISAGNNGIDISLPAPASVPGDKVPENTYQYPAAYRNLENVIVVAAVSNNAKEYPVRLNSNYSSSFVHIAAPGDGIYSTLSSNHSKSYESKDGFTIGGSGCYTTAQGTSQASPFVAGTAVLLMSAYPSKSVREIRNAILQGANAKYASDKTIYGLLDAKGAFDIMAGKAVKPGIPIDDIHFPDAAFREYILSEIDSNGDSRLNDAEITETLRIDISGRKVTSLKGIIHFTELRELNCSRTDVEYLDFSNEDQQTSLGALADLRSFKAENSTKLEYLNFYGGNLSEISITGCTKLRTFKCSANEVKYLDLRGLTSLTEIECDENMLAAIDLPEGFSGKLISSDQLLNTAKITKTGDNQWEIDISKFVGTERRNNISGIRFSKKEVQEGATKFVADIGYTYTFNKANGIISVGSSLVIDGKPQALSMPASMAYDYWAGGDHVLSVIMALSDKVEEEPEPEPENDDHADINTTNFPDSNFLSYVRNFDTDKDGRFSPEEIRRVTSLYVPSRGIISLKGAEIFTSVISLDCRSNNITDINSIIRVMTSMRSLQCGNNKIVNLNITSHPALEYVSCGMSTLKSINLSGCQKLNTLIVDKKNTITSLNISGTALKDLSAWSNGALETFDASGCTALKRIYCSSNSLASLNITGCLALEELSCGRNNIKELNLSGLTALKNVDCSENSITSLTIKGCSSLASLNCEKNSISSLELDGAPSLSFINCGNNPITELDITALQSIETVLCAGCNISLLKASNSRTLKRLDCRNNALTEIDLSGCSALERLTIYDYSEGSNPLRKLNINGCEALRYLSGLGGEISEVSAENCKKLTGLSLGGNMTTLSVKGCTSLDTLSCIDSKMESLDISGCVSLKYLYCEGNNLPFLTLANLPALIKVTCGRNKLSTLDIIGCPSLYNLDCSENSISAISLSGCPHLHLLYCYSNDLHALDVSPCVSLDTLDCRNNHLPYIDLNLPTYHAKLYGQILNELPLTETGNSSWPYSFSFSRIIPSDRIENIAGWPSGYEINHVRAEINAYDENGSTISMNYSDGTAYFSERPSSMIYGYNVLSRILNATIYFAGSDGHNTTPGAPAENEDTPPSDNTGNDDNTPSSGNDSTGNRDDNLSDEITGNIRAILGVDENVPVHNLTRDNANIGTDRKDNTVRYADGLRVLALLPEIQVYTDGVYIIPVSFDTPAHLGEYLTWHSFYDDVVSDTFSSSRNEVCVFLNEDGSELTMPLTREIDYLKVATYLETGKIYAPAISAETSSANTENPSTSSGGGGCEAFTTLWAFFAVFIIVMKKTV